MSFRSLSFRFYFPVLVVALAGAVFGLGAIFGLGVVKPSSPPPAKAAAETKFTTEPKVVQKKSPVEQVTASSALSPIYPTKPGAPRADESAAPPAAQADKAAPPPAAQADKAAAPPAARAEEAAAKSAPRTDEHAKPTGVAAPPAAEASAAAKVTEAAPPPDKPTAAQGIQAGATASADSDKTTGSVPHEDVARAPAAKPAVKPAAKPAVKPAEAVVARGSSKSCDVRACASAYKSFRESDCTYQPFAGPRQVCEGPPGGRSTFASEPHERRSSVARERAQREVEDDASDDRGSTVYEADDEDDGPRGDRRVIVIEPQRQWRDWR